MRAKLVPRQLPTASPACPHSRMKYIETELKKRKGIVEHEEQKVKAKNAEDCLYELPENIRVASAKRTEEMLSNQMLSGIPEVDLGIE